MAMHILAFSVIAVSLIWGLICLGQDIINARNNRFNPQYTADISQDRQLGLGGAIDAVSDGEASHAIASHGDLETGVDFGEVIQHVGHVFHH